MTVYEHNQCKSKVPLDADGAVCCVISSCALLLSSLWAHRPAVLGETATDASRTRPQPFLPVVTPRWCSAHMPSRSGHKPVASGNCMNV
eukprot:gene10971-biopygen16831